MEMTIHSHVIKGLMERQNLNQQALADKAGLGIATIKRICSGKGMAKGQRRHTLSALAKALRVEEAALTAPDLPPSEDDEHLKSLVNLKASINRKADLSFQAVEAIYGISRSAQVAMAPLFAALIAEASLKWRQERLAALGSVIDQFEAVRGDNPLLLGAFARAWEAEKIEKQSIEAKDVLGHTALHSVADVFESATADLDVSSGCDITLPSECVSPFLSFLKDFAGSFAHADVDIELSDEDGNPQIPSGVADYRVGEKLFAEICGQSVWAKVAVEFGHVRLTDVPADLMDPSRFQERVDFFKNRIPHKQRVARALEEIEFLNTLSESEEPIEATDERIERVLSHLDREHL